MNALPAALPYRGRLAPSPTGYLHLGHARTFWHAQQRARQHQGTLLLRNEDLDHARCRTAYVEAMYEDLRWFGLRWQEGPDLEGPHAPYTQSRRLPVYRAALRQLRETGWLYPCSCSRRDILQALTAPHSGEEEPVYPGTCRPPRPSVNRRRRAEDRPRGATRQPSAPKDESAAAPPSDPLKVSWRFQVPDGQAVRFVDGHWGAQAFVAGRDFGDFIVWRHDDLPSYQLAVVVDDHAMGITEVVRGADLLTSTARQLLLYDALGWTPPQFYHCPLMTDEQGVRLAKRHDALSLRTLREQGLDPERLRAGWSVWQPPA